MRILFLPLPLWLFLAVIIVAALLVDLQHRRLKRRMKRLEGIINNMDRWADHIENQLGQR